LPGSARRATCSRYVDGAIGGALQIGSTPVDLASGMVLGPMAAHAEPSMKAIMA
jgi:hypothetical protein